MRGWRIKSAFLFCPLNAAAHRLQPVALAALPLQQAEFKSSLSNFHTCPSCSWGHGGFHIHFFFFASVLRPPSLQAEPILIERSRKRRLLTNYKPNGWLSLTLRPLRPPEVGKTFWPINVTAIGKHLNPLLPRMTNEERLIRWFAESEYESRDWRRLNVFVRGGRRRLTMKLQVPLLEGHIKVNMWPTTTAFT